MSDLINSPQLHRIWPKRTVGIMGTAAFTASPLTSRHYYVSAIEPQREPRPFRHYLERLPTSVKLVYHPYCAIVRIMKYTPEFAECFGIEQEPPSIEQPVKTTPTIMLDSSRPLQVKVMLVGGPVNGDWLLAEEWRTVIEVRKPRTNTTFYSSNVEQLMGLEDYDMAYDSYYYHRTTDVVNGCVVFTVEGLVRSLTQVSTNFLNFFLSRFIRVCHLANQGIIF